MTCTQPDCTRKHHANGLCYAHYMRAFKGYKTTGPIREPRIAGIRPCGHKRCPAAQKMRSVLHYLTHKDEYLARAKAQPVEQLRKAKDKWKGANGAKVKAHVLGRKHRLRGATPPWLTDAHWAEMNAVYAEARRLSEETGIPHHVDHIVPLSGRTVCGLHVPWNLRAIPAEDNMKRKRVWVSG